MLTVTFGNSDKYRNIVYWIGCDTYSFIKEEGDSLFLYNKDCVTLIDNENKEDGDRSLIFIDSLGFTRASYKGLMSSSLITKTQLAVFPRYYPRNNIKDLEAVQSENDEIEIILPVGFRGVALIALGFDFDKPVIYGARFNPARESIVNKRFGHEIGGQVLSFHVVVLRDILLQDFPNRVAVKE